MKRTGKRMLAILLSMVLLLSGGASVPLLAAPTAGAGKFLAAIEAPESGSIAISTAAELDAIRNNLSGHYHLTADIDLSDWGNWTPIGLFSGVFDGQGHVIYGLTVTGSVQYAGLFGYAANAVIKNVGLEDGKIDVYFSTLNASVSSYAYAGGLVGYGSGSTITISNSYNANDVSANGAGGGLVGFGYGSASTITISDSYNTGDVSTTNNNGTVYAGGLVGYGSTVTISNSYNAGDIVSSTQDVYVYYSYAGGLVSRGSTITISNSYNVGDVSSAVAYSQSLCYSYAGGLVGGGSTTISNSYNAGDISSTTYHSNAGGLVGNGGSGSTAIKQCLVLSDYIQATTSSYLGTNDSYLIGYAPTGVTKTNNLARNDISGNALNDADQLLDLAEFYKQSTYEALGWDFDTVWEINNSDGPAFPTLRRYVENPVEDPAPDPEVVITGITIASLPDKTAYTTGETLDLSGLAVDALYSDGSTVDITSVVSSDPAAGTILSDVGQQTVTVSYREGNLLFPNHPGWIDWPGEIDFPGWITDDGLYTTIWSAEFTVTVTAPEPDYGSINVGPSSIVQDHLSYIHVLYGEALGNANADFALLGKDGQIVGASVKGVNGRAVIGITAPNEPGFYDVVAQVGGKTVAQGSIEVLPYNPNIWQTWYSISSTGTIVINFNEGIATKDKKYDGIVSVNGKVVKSYLDGDRSLVTDVAWDDLADGTTLFSSKGIIYPRLYPSYSFTFPTTVEKP